MESFSNNSEENKSSAVSKVDNAGYSTYYIFAIILGVFVFVYFMRDQLFKLYNDYVAESVKRLIGESMLKMLYLSPTGDFMSTYIPKADSSVSTIKEIELDELRLDP